MEDRSIKYPLGVIEDVLIKVDKFYLPADFITLDMEEDSNVFLILGRLFLVTGRTLIDVKKGELILRRKMSRLVSKFLKLCHNHRMSRSASKLILRTSKLLNYQKRSLKSCIAKSPNSPSLPSLRM